MCMYVNHIDSLALFIRIHVYTAVLLFTMQSIKPLYMFFRGIPTYVGVIECMF